MLKKMRQQCGETLLETLIGLVIIGLVMMCLPMAVTATAEINGKVAEQKTIVTMNSDVTSASVEVLNVTDNVPGGSAGTYSVTINQEDIPLEDSDATVWEQQAVTGYTEKDQNGNTQFYYYEYSIK